MRRRREEPGTREERAAAGGEERGENPLRNIGLLGWWSVLRYLLGWLTLNKALGELSQRLHVAIAPVHLPYPEAAIDVDSIADQRLVEDIAGSDR